LDIRKSRFDPRSGLDLDVFAAETSAPHAADGSVTVVRLVRLGLEVLDSEDVSKFRDLWEVWKEACSALDLEDVSKFQDLWEVSVAVC